MLVLSQLGVSQLGAAIPTQAELLHHSAKFEDCAHSAKRHEHQLIKISQKTPSSWRAPRQEPWRDALQDEAHHQQSNGNVPAFAWPQVLQTISLHSWTSRQAVLLMTTTCQLRTAVRNQHAATATLRTLPPPLRQTTPCSGMERTSTPSTSQSYGIDVLKMPYPVTCGLLRGHCRPAALALETAPLEPCECTSS